MAPTFISAREESDFFKKTSSQIFKYNKQILWCIFSLPPLINNGFRLIYYLSFVKSTSPFHEIHFRGSCEVWTLILNTKTRHSEILTHIIAQPFSFHFTVAGGGGVTKTPKNRLS